MVAATDSRPDTTAQIALRRVARPDGERSAPAPGPEGDPDADPDVGPEYYLG